MSDFGAHLKQARERRGISQRQIASSTKISTVALDALERGDFSKLPGGIFSRAFVRAYAVEVGLNPDETLAEFDKALGTFVDSRNDDADRPEVTADDRRFLEQQRKAAIVLRVVLVVLAVLIIAAIAWWRFVWSVRSTSMEVPVPQAVVATPEPAPVQTTASAEGSATPTTPALVVEIETTGACWVQILADGVSVVSREMNNGAREVVQANRELTLQFGSAGLVRWTINGKPARPLGRPGDVRTVLLTPSNVADFLQ
jgi:cytoskeletal protein RodZ